MKPAPLIALRVLAVLRGAETLDSFANRSPKAGNASAALHNSPAVARATANQRPGRECGEPDPSAMGGGPCPDSPIRRPAGVHSCLVALPPLQEDVMMAEVRLEGRWLWLGGVYRTIPPKYCTLLSVYHRQQQYPCYLQLPPLRRPRVYSLDSSSFGYQTVTALFLQALLIMRRQKGPAQRPLSGAPKAACAWDGVR